jgi:hypothetical protein
MAETQNELDLTDVLTETPEEVVDPAPVEEAAEEVVETPAESTDGETPLVEEEVPEPTWVERITDAGFATVEDETEESAMDRLYEAYQSRDRELQESNARQAEMQRQAEYAQYQANQQPAPQVETPAEPTPTWNPPNHDPTQAARYRQVTTDPTTGAQTETWRDETPVEVKVNAEAHQAYTQDWAERLTHNPTEALQPFIQEEATKLFERMFSERSEAMSRDTFFERIDRDHASELYAIDPVSQAPIVGQDGQRVFSEYGNNMKYQMGVLSDAGVANEEEQWNIARQMVAGHVAETRQVASAATESATEAATRKRSEHLTRAAGIPARGGSETPVDTPNAPKQNRHQTGGQDLVEALSAAGVI